MPIDELSDGRASGHAATGRLGSSRGLITIVVIALVAAMAARLLTERDELAAFRQLSTKVILATVFLQFLSQLFWNGAMLLPLRTFMIRLGFWELFMVRTGGFVAGYIVPVAGNLAVRMAYLQRRGLTYAEFTWATIVSNVLSLFSGGLLAVVALGALWKVAGTPPVSVVGLTAGVSALGVAGLATVQFLPRLAGHPRLQNWPWLSGMSAFTTSRRTTVWLLILLCLQQVANFLTFGLLFQSLSQVPLDFVTGGLVNAITSPVRMVVITPGNLGINEWVVAIVGKVLSVDLTTGLLVALVFRGVSIAGQMLGVVIGWAWLALLGKP